MKKLATPSDVTIKTTPDASNQFNNFKNVLLVVVPTLIIFAAFRNSRTLHLQQLWASTGDYWQDQWIRLLEKVGDDEYTHYVWGTFLLSTVVYWVWGLMFTLMDVTLKPATLRKYKIQPGTNEPVDPKVLKKVVKAVYFNQVVVNFPMALGVYYLARNRGIPDIRVLPSFHQLLFEFIIFTLLEEIGFYYSHRLMHSKYLYRRIHKKHHELTSPIGLGAMYAHPLEHAISNVAPLVLGPAVMKSHVITLWLWFVLGIVITIISHSGYHFPLFFSSEFHDFHHLKFNECYGVIGILDWLHKTDTLFRSSGVIKRNQMLTSLTPMREIYPLSDANNSK